MKKITTAEFILKAKEIHPFCIYEKTNYINSLIKVIVTDIEHGDFEINPGKHIKGQGHRKRNNINELTTARFIEKAMSVHDNLYDYSKTIYTGIANTILISDPLHGEFEQIARYHLKGCGHPNRAHENRTKTMLKLYGVDNYAKKHIPSQYHYLFTDIKELKQFCKNKTAREISTLLNISFHHVFKYFVKYDITEYNRQEEYHIDHIVPISAFCKRRDKGSKYWSVINHPNNLRKISNIENLKKSDIIVWKDQIYKGRDIRGNHVLLKEICLDLISVDIDQVIG